MIRSLVCWALFLVHALARHDGPHEHRQGAHLDRGHRSMKHPQGVHLDRGHRSTGQSRGARRAKPNFDDNPDRRAPGEPSRRDVTATFAASPTWGTWQGWGTSLAWWAARFGDNEVLADLFFTLDDEVELNGETLPGLGLNIVRYNAGATSFVPWGDLEMQVSPNIGTSRQVDAFWVNGDSTDPESSSWDWDADPKQRLLTQRAIERGVNYVELFSNSPVWWQCINLNPSGANVSTDDNLPPEQYRNHAIYMASVAKKARDDWGVTFDTVEAFNEPTSPYWFSSGSQEGCHFDASTMAEVLPLLREELDARGLEDMKIAASDDTSFSASTSAWDSFNNLGVLDLVDQWNVHGYEYEGGDRVGLYSRVHNANKVLWESEYGGNDGDGKRAVTNIFLDFRYLHMTAWVYWQVLDGGGWGLINSDVEGSVINDAEQKFFGIAHFTRHIREGMTVLDSPGPNIIAAYEAVKERLVIVAANFEDDAQDITFDLSQLGGAPDAGTQVRRWVSRIGTGGGSSDRYEASHDDTVVDTDASFTLHFEVDVLMTFEIDGVVI